MRYMTLRGLPGQWWGTACGGVIVKSNCAKLLRLKSRGPSIYLDCQVCLTSFGVSLHAEAKRIHGSQLDR